MARSPAGDDDAAAGGAIFRTIMLPSAEKGGTTDSERGRASGAVGTKSLRRADRMEASRTSKPFEQLRGASSLATNATIAHIDRRPPSRELAPIDFVGQTCARTNIRRRRLIVNFMMIFGVKEKSEAS